MTCAEFLVIANILRKAQMEPDRYVILKADRHVVEMVIESEQLPYHTIGWDAVGRKTLVEKK